MKTVLFTGAGFTYNFGGYLAKEMWEHIFTHREIKKYPKLNRITNADFDYESIYYKVHGDPQYTAEEVEAIDRAILDAYGSLDNRIKQVKWNDSQPLIYPVNKMIEEFSGNLGGGKLFFTLNQDLYVERYFSSSSTHLHHPFINNNIWAIRDKDFSDDYYVIAPQKPLEHPESLKVSKFHYIKLHGSFNWKRSDGTNMMVIGQDKERRIAEEPLLTINFDIFKNELRQEGVRLLVIGYGFADKHINEVIGDSLKNYGLTLVAVAPWEPWRFMQILRTLSDKRHDEISQNYFSFGKTLSELFLPNDGTWKKIRDIIFS